MKSVTSDLRAVRQTPSRLERSRWRGNGDRRADVACAVLYDRGDRQLSPFQYLELVISDYLRNTGLDERMRNSRSWTCLRGDCRRSVWRGSPSSIAWSTWIGRLRTACLWRPIRRPLKEAIYRLTSLAFFEDRFVLPPGHSCALFLAPSGLVLRWPYRLGIVPQLMRESKRRQC